MSEGTHHCMELRVNPEVAQKIDDLHAALRELKEARDGLDSAVQNLVSALLESPGGFVEIRPVSSGGDVVPGDDVGESST